MAIYGNIYKKATNIASTVNEVAISFEDECRNYQRLFESFDILSESSIILEFSIKEIFGKIVDFFKKIIGWIVDLIKKIFGKGKKEENKKKIEETKENLKKAAKAAEEGKDVKANEESAILFEASIDDEVPFYSYKIANNATNEEIEITYETLFEAYKNLVSAFEDIRKKTSENDLVGIAKKIYKGEKPDIEEFEKMIDDTEDLNVMRSMKFVNFKQMLSLKKEKKKGTIKEAIKYYESIVPTCEKLNNELKDKFEEASKEIQKAAEQYKNILSGPVTSILVNVEEHTSGNGNTYTTGERVPGVEVEYREEHKNSNGTRYATGGNVQIPTSFISRYAKVFSELAVLCKDIETIIAKLDKISDSYIDTIKKDSEKVWNYLK